MPTVYHRNTLQTKIRHEPFLTPFKQQLYKVLYFIFAKVVTNLTLNIATKT